MNYAVFPIKNNYCPRGDITFTRFPNNDMLLFHVKQRICDARRNHHAVFFYSSKSNRTSVENSQSLSANIQTAKMFSQES
jgi:hypothetical protein